MAGWDSSEKVMSESIDQEDVQEDSNRSFVGCFHDDNDDNDIDTVEEHMISTTRVPLISTCHSSIQNIPTSIPSSTSNSST